MRTRISVRGPRPAAEVWEQYAQPAQWSSWSPQITSVDYAGDRLAAGGTGRVHGPLGARVDFTIDSFDDLARRFAWTVRPGPLGRPELRMTHGVDVLGTGSETWLELTGPLPVVLAYRPLARLALRRLVG